MGVTVIVPITITPAMVIATDVAESDYAAWSSSTTYGLGDRVTDSTNHLDYESLQAGNINRDPVSQPAWWVEISASKRHKMFDTSRTTATVKTGGFSYTLAPATIINAIVLDNLTAGSIRVRGVDPVAGAVYDRTINLKGSISAPSWYAFLFDPIENSRKAVFEDLPAYRDAAYQIDVMGAGEVSCGICLLGRSRDFGLFVKAGLRLRTISYSRKETNAFGDTVFVKRFSASSIEAQLLVENRRLEALRRLFEELDAVPAFWIISNELESLNVFGFFTSFQTLIAYASHNDCELTIQELT